MQAALRMPLRFPSALTPVPFGARFAFAEKVLRLKQAKSEAEAEIAEYKQKREAQFATFSKEVSRRTRALHLPRALLRALSAPPRVRPHASMRLASALTVHSLLRSAPCSAALSISAWATPRATPPS
jgi:hypothetical protein